MNIIETPIIYRGFRIELDPHTENNKAYVLEGLTEGWGGWSGNVFPPLVTMDTVVCHPDMLENVKLYIDKLKHPEEFNKKLIDLVNED